jgi:hypothetical protein
MSVAMEDEIKRWTAKRKAQAQGPAGSVRRGDAGAADGFEMSIS